MEEQLNSTVFIIYFLQNRREKEKVCREKWGEVQSSLT